MAPRMPSVTSTSLSTKVSSSAVSGLRRRPHGALIRSLFGKVKEASISKERSEERLDDRRAAICSKNNIAKAGPWEGPSSPLGSARA